MPLEYVPSYSAMVLLVIISIFYKRLLSSSFKYVLPDFDFAGFEGGYEDLQPIVNAPFHHYSR